MTVDAIGTTKPTVFDAGLPSIAYEHAHSPEEAHRLIRQARRQGPIAPGPDWAGALAVGPFDIRIAALVFG